MSLHKNEKPVEKKNQLNIAQDKQARHQDELVGEPGQQMDSEMGISIPSQAAHFQEPRFLTTQRQGMARKIGRVAGNRHLQRVLAPEKTESSVNKNPGAGTVVQRGVWEALGEWWSDLFSTDPEDVVENLDSGLQRANTVLEAAASATADPQRRQQLERMREHVGGLQGATGRMVQVLETADAIGKVEDFIEALNDIPDNIASDPEAAADAFGRLFASAGELGQLLPQGPWTMYFEFLGGMRNFFTDMSRAINPDLRWRREFEEIEREAGNATTRGVD